MPVESYEVPPMKANIESVRQIQYCTLLLHGTICYSDHDHSQFGISDEELRQIGYLLQ
jgi:hypothetical protein